ncbi:uncharacterized protein HMPREF1541_00823 [Cyphellophora europaea CBS 101466]|uniref:Uncharacterized protein n=1 Tax=Cyphellophora europaea (strain CBS 101466) TaxID=1220924 RepID=W2SD53_CYPE1|nr:uncharacterized protein HMPREF1541_00823 [Cyphellophora europaea CBS 101466]ETN46637.1 hypothetical protein HMPREF1541_00823 [Cyphellophora europaea CBS 101466]
MASRQTRQPKNHQVKRPTIKIYLKRNEDGKWKFVKPPPGARAQTQALAHRVPKATQNDIVKSIPSKSDGTTTTSEKA